MAGALRLWCAGVVVTMTGWPCAGQSEPAAPKQERKVVATAETAEFDEAHRTVLFQGSATLTTNEGTISGREMEARLGEGDTIELAEVRGEVKLDFRYTDRRGVERMVRGSADRAIYRAAGRTVELLGRVTATVKEPARERTLDISADEVTLWVDESRLRIRPARLVFSEVVPEQPEPTAPAQ